MSDVDEIRLRRQTGRKWSAVSSDVLPAWIADMDLPIAPSIRSTLEEAIALCDVGYGPPAGASGIAEAFADWAMLRWGWHVDPADVLLASDVVTAIVNCIEALTEPDDTILVRTPAYPPFLSMVRAAGRCVVEFPVRGAEDYDDAFEAAVDRHGVRLILLSNPHNPTGLCARPDALARLSAIAARHNLLVISDEIHADLVFPGQGHKCLAAVDENVASRTITLNSASKAFNVAGLRTAVCVAPRPLLKRLRALPATRWEAFSTLGLRATRAAWSPDGLIWLENCIAHLAQMRELVFTRFETEIPAIVCTRPEASYLAWLDFQAVGLTDPARQLLSTAKVALSSGSDFGRGWESFARLNYATSKPLLDEILDRLIGAIR